MKRKGLIAVLLAVFLLGAAEAKDEGLGFFSISAAAKMQEKLGAGFTVAGNAAETYFKYMMKDAAIGKEGWFTALDGVNILEPVDGQQKQIVAAALAQGESDLKAIAEAGKMKDYQLWGNLFKPDTTKNIYNVDIPSYINLMKLTKLVIVQGRQKAGAGDKAGAREDYLAAYRIGAHLQRDPISLGYMAGAILQIEAVKALIALGDGPADETDLGFLEGRRDAFKQIMTSMAAWGRERVEQFVKDEDMPLCLRLDCLGTHYHCASSTLNCLYCYYTGNPRWAKELAETAKFSDPQAQLFLAIMKNKLGDKAVCYAISVLE